MSTEEMWKVLAKLPLTGYWKTMARAQGINIDISPKDVRSYTAVFKSLHAARERSPVMEGGYVEAAASVNGEMHVYVNTYDYCELGWTIVEPGWLEAQVEAKLNEFPFLREEMEKA